MTDEADAYRLAFADREFLMREESRAARLELEYLKPELVQLDEGINSTVVIFGSARTLQPEDARKRLEDARTAQAADPDNPELLRQVTLAENIEKNSVYYEEARKLGAMITRDTLASGPCDMVVMTGGGPGIMEAANRGAKEAGGKSIGLNIQLAFEQEPNPYVTPHLCFQFHYFAIRKLHFLKRARALVACPGGFGTLDELFDALTLVQTGRIDPLPILLMGRRFWRRALDFDALVEEGVISPEDIQLMNVVDTAEDAWRIIRDFYRMP